jgi:hypothetical protein
MQMVLAPTPLGFEQAPDHVLGVGAVLHHQLAGPGCITRNQSLDQPAAVIAQGRRSVWLQSTLLFARKLDQQPHKELAERCQQYVMCGVCEVAQKGPEAL